MPNDEKVSRAKGAFIALPIGKSKKWERLAKESGMTKSKYARSAVVHALDNDLVFKEVRTFKVITATKKPEC